MKGGTAINVAVVGATGAVGETMIKILEQRDFPVAQIFPLASERSVGKVVMFRGKAVRVQDLATFDFAQTPVGFFSAGGSVSAEFAPKAVASGCVVIDNTSHFRNDPGIPLVVPEVNAHALDAHEGLIANPNCSTIQLVVALKPIYDAVGIKRINVATYQAVSGAGRRAIERVTAEWGPGICAARVREARALVLRTWPRQDRDDVVSTSALRPVSFHDEPAPAADIYA